MSGEDRQMMSNQDRLIYMANQIARNFATMGDESAADATADHIARFWDPRMKAQIRDVLAARPGLLSAVAAAAVARLREGAIAHQTRATEFNAMGEGGHCDAG